MKRLSSMFFGAVAFLAPLAAYASEGASEHEGIPWSTIGFHALNLALLIVFLVWVARRPLSDSLKTRATEIRRAIEDAQHARDEARARCAELEQKLSTFQTEVDRLQRETREEAEKERIAIIERAEREAEATRASAELAIREETRRARRILQEEAVQIAIQLAEETLRQQVTPADQERLAEQLLATVRQNDSDGRSHGA